MHSTVRRLSTALDCSLPNYIRSSDPRSNRQDLCRSATTSSVPWGYRFLWDNLPVTSFRVLVALYGCGTMSVRHLLVGGFKLLSAARSWQHHFALCPLFLQTKRETPKRQELHSCGCSTWSYNLIVIHLCVLYLLKVSHVLSP